MKLKMIAVLLGLGLAFGSNAQINHNTNTDEILIDPPPGSLALPMYRPGTVTNSANPTLGCIFEYGDGRFTTSSVTARTIVQSGPFQKHALVTYNYRYVKPPKPRVQTAAVNRTPIAGGNADTALLGPTEYLKIFSSANEVIEEDMMVFIITYKLPPGVNSAKIAFFYSDTKLNVFQPIAANDQFLSPSFGMVNHVRTHYNETSISIPSWPLLATNPNRSPGSAGLAWQVTGNPDEERNIFVTLISKADLVIKDNYGFLEAVMIPDSVRGSKGGEPDLIRYPLQISASGDPHDPNFISAIPSCIKTNPAGKTKTVRFHVHCQNEGDGEAYKIDVHSQMPLPLKGILNPMNIKARVGGEDYIIPANSIVVDNAKATILFKIDKQTQFTLASNKVPIWPINPLTMSDIYFDQEVPIDKDADLVSYSGIVFYNSIQKPMDTVFTAKDTVRIRLCEACGCSLPPNTKPGPDPEPLIPPGPGSAQPGFLEKWWWLFLIPVGGLFIFLLFRRRRKEEKPEAERKY